MIDENQFIKTRARRPKAQYFSELPDIESDVPSLLSSRALTYLAGAQARKLYTQGNYQEELYTPLKNSELNKKHEIILPHENGQQVETKDIIRDCDLVVAEVSSLALPIP